MTITLKRLLASGLLLYLLYLAAICGLSWLMTQPDNLKLQTPDQGLYQFPSGHDRLTAWQGVQSNPLAGYGIEYEDVSFPTDHGETLRGWLVSGASEKTIIAVHGAGSDRRGFLRQLPYLHEAGYTVLLFDCREHGVSDGRGRGVSFGVRESRDVLAAAAFLRTEKGIENIALFGTSQGAASVLIAASKDKSLSPVIAENPFSDLQSLLSESLYDGENNIPSWLAVPAATLTWYRAGGLDTPSPLQAAATIEQPVLLMHSSADKLIALEHSEKIYRALPGLKQQWFVGEAAHSRLFNRYPKDYQQLIIGFLSNNL